MRLAAAATLFVGWLGWLLYLAVDHAKPVVLSASQMAAADTFVIAEATRGPDGLPQREVKVVEVLRGPEGKHAPAGAVQVANIKSARLPYNKSFPEVGTFLLPLRRLADGTYELVASPASPGYYENTRPWAYPWTDEVRREAERHGLVGGR